MIITISSLKGGVGKTTLTAFLAHALKAMGKSVLVVDLDHNNNLTDYYLREDDVSSIEACNVRHVLTGKARLTRDRIEEGRLIPGAIMSSLMGEIVPSTPSLAQVGYELATDPMAILRFRNAIRSLEYDFVLLDTPPALTLELSAGLYSGDAILVPVTSSRWAVQGYQVIEAEVMKVGDTLGKSPRMLAVPSMVSETEAEALRGVDIWKATATSIRRDPAIRLAASEGRALREGTIGQQAFLALAREVVG